MVINRAVFHDKFGDESYTSRIPLKALRTIKHRLKLYLTRENPCFSVRNSHNQYELLNR